MPSTATITAFTTFTSGTKAKAEEVNANYSVFRGHIIPVDPTAASSVTDLSYALGSATHRWGESYLEKLNLGQTTTSWKLSESTASGATIATLNFIKNANTVAAIKYDRFYAPHLEVGTSAAWSFKDEGGTTTARLVLQNSGQGVIQVSNSVGCEFFAEGVTMASLYQGGTLAGIELVRGYFEKAPGTTTVQANTTGSMHTVLHDISITTYGRRYEIGFKSDDNFWTTTGQGFGGLFRSGTGGGQWDVVILDGSSVVIGMQSFNAPTSTVGLPSSSFRYMTATLGAAGTATGKTIRVKTVSSGSGSNTLDILNSKIFVRELSNH